MAESIVSDVESSGIYQIRNLVNGKRYIGSAKCFRDRWRVHVSSLRLGRHHSAYLQRSWDMHGEESFLFEVVELCQISDLISREQSWLDAHSPEYNISPTAANCTGVKHSAATKLKHSLAMKGRKFPEAAAKRVGQKRTPQQRARMSEAQKKARALWSPEAKARLAEASRRTHLGSKRSPESIAKAAAKLRGRKRPLEVVEKCREALSGRKLSLEHRANMSAARKGKPATEAMLMALRANAKKRVGVPRPPHVVEAIRRAASNRSSETRAKISAANSGRKLSAEAIAKRTATRRAKGGYVVGEEHRRKLSAAGMGRIQSPETRAKLSASKKGRKLHLVDGRIRYF